MKTTPFEEIEHTADIALRVRGESLAELLENAARGLIHVLKPQFSQGGPETRRLQLEAEDAETLLVSWLEELLYLLETEWKLPARMDLRVETNLHLTAELELAICERVQTHVKAVTFNELEVRSSQDGLVATVVLDV